jgi:ech hydrogenase subunit D
MGQQIIDIQLSELLDRVKEMQAKGARLVQICATKLPDCLQLQYSFDEEFEFTSFRLTLANVDGAVPSISGIYLSAFLYENEIHDLFGVKITDIAVDFKGKFYRTTTPRAFNPEQAAGEVKA